MGKNMKYDGLETSYWSLQSNRVATLLDKVNSRESALSNGRIIPEDNDLALGVGRRIKMAVLFLDISKFSSRDMETEAEQNNMLNALNLYFTEMIKIAEDYGGTVEKNTGDGLMAYFEDNGGSPPERGCKRAIACSLTMFAANKEIISPILSRSGIAPFEFRISIDYGYVTIAKLGAARRFNQYVAIGATANFAAKMLAKAPPNKIVIGEGVKLELPLDWQLQFTSISPETSGWVLKNTSASYNLYEYTGRWNKLI
ncbi:MAG: adenylate/guanylate cyclase domain-containing protein [Gammaproteobacteria bacterium]|nr:adenylate/guanylate cyclase domain-containing protein [Gammaproteobacteria bacterium]